MIAVIFEVEPHPEKRDAYLDLAGEMRSLLEDADGFLSIERFESLTQPDKLLSLSFWRDEEAVTAWRKLERHRHAQAKGRTSYFRDYRLRIAGVLRDYGMNERDQAPADSVAMHG